jgi:hypothetical protein
MAGGGGRTRIGSEGAGPEDLSGRVFTEGRALKVTGATCAVSAALPPALAPEGETARCLELAAMPNAAGPGTPPPLLAFEGLVPLPYAANALLTAAASSGGVGGASGIPSWSPSTPAISPPSEPGTEYKVERSTFFAITRDLNSALSIDDSIPSARRDGSANRSASAMASEDK